MLGREALLLIKLVYRPKASPAPMFKILHFLLVLSLASSLRAEDSELKVPLGAGLPMSEWVIAGKPAGFFVLDTGSPRSLVDPRLAQAFQLSTASGGAPLPGRRVLLKNFRSGGWGFEQALFTVLGQPRFDGRLPKPVQGVIGCDLLGLRPFTLELGREKLVLHSAADFTAPAGARSIALKIKDGCPLIQLEVAGAKRWLRLDTTLTCGLLLNRGIEVPEKLLSPQSFLAGGLLQWRMRVRSVDLSAAAAEGLQLPLGRCFQMNAPSDPLDPSEGSLGTEFLRQVSLTCDFSAGKAWLRPAPLALPAAGHLEDLDIAGDTSLARACRDGHLSRVRELLAAGAKTHFSGHHGQNLIHAAVEGGDVRIVNLLLSLGLNPDTSNEAGLSPLHFAARQDRVDLMQVLLTAGAQLRRVDNDGLNALHIAALFDSAAAIELLARSGLGLNDGDKSGACPLHLAAASGSLHSVALLLQLGAEPSKLDKLGRSCLHAAALSGDPELIRLVASKIKPMIESEDSEGETPLLGAIRSGQASAVRALLKLGANPRHSQGKTQLSPLSLAYKTGDADILAALEEALAP